MSSSNRADVCVFCAMCLALRLLPLALSLKPQWHKDYLRRREGQTMHYGLRKILCCAASKATLLILRDLLHLFVRIRVIINRSPIMHNRWEWVTIEGKGCPFFSPFFWFSFDFCSKYSDFVTDYL